MIDTHSDNPWLPEPPEPPAPAEPPISPPPGPKRSLPEDVQTPWGWRELLLFVVVALASLILLTNAMAEVAMFWLKVHVGDIEKYASTSASFLSLRQAIWYAVLILYLYATIHLGNHMPFWRTIGWRRLPPSAMPRAAAYAICLVSGVLLALVAELGSYAFRTKAELPIEALFHDRRGIFWLMAIGILLAPAVEEMIFRGYLYPVLARSLGVDAGIIVTGVLFGMMHAPQLWGGWGQIGVIMLVGIALTYARARSGTILTSWLLHLGYNTFLFVGFFVSTGGLRHLPPGP